MKCSVECIEMRTDKIHNTLPLVSVVIPLYNREKTIQRAVDSVLNQTYENIEVIVVDDCSNDKSIEKLHKYEKDGRVRIFYQDKNSGANAARNRGIQEARGEYIAFQDSDDEWLPCKLERQIPFMIKQESFATFCPVQRHYGKAVQTIPNIRGNLSGTEIRNRLRESNIITTPALVVNKKVVAKIGLFDEEMPRLQDYEFVIRIAKQFDISYLDEPFVVQYEMNDSISLKRDSLSQAQLLLLRKHADFINIETLWNEYLKAKGILNERNIPWEIVDKTIDSITKNNPFCTREILYKATVNGIQNRYINLKMYEQYRYHTMLEKLENSKFAIYGAGLYGREAYYHFKKQGLQPECFLVTEISGNNGIDNIPIYALKEWKVNENPIIIAVLGNAQIEIIEKLKQRGIENYYIYPSCE